VSKGKKRFNMPSRLAQSRLLAGGKWQAGNLLYRVRLLWTFKGKLRRFGREWIAMPRADWARSAGLSISEIKIAIAALKKKCDFITIRKMKLTPKDPCTLWVSLDEARMIELFDHLDDYALTSGNVIDYHNPEPTLKGIGYEPGVVDDDDEDDDC
jgi:hypothetical protein